MCAVHTKDELLDFLTVNTPLRDAPGRNCSSKLDILYTEHS